MLRRVILTALLVLSVSMATAQKVLWTNPIRLTSRTAEWLQKGIQTKDGNTILGGMSESALSAVKVDLHGQKIWDFQWDSPDMLGSDLLDIVEDPDGSCYLSGSYSTAGSVVIKLNSSGEVVWTCFPGTAATAWYARRLFIGPSDSLYVLGWSGTNAGLLTISKQSGLIVKTSDLGTSYPSEARSLPSGDLIVATDEGQVSRIKPATGQVVWNYQGPARYGALNLAVGPNGEVVTARSTYEGTEVTRFDPATGTVRSTYNAPDMQLDNRNDQLFVGYDGEAFVNGRTSTGNNVLLKVTARGALRWKREIPQPTSSRYYGSAIAMQSDGTILALAQYSNYETSFYVFYRITGSSGGIQFAKTLKSFQLSSFSTAKVEAQNDVVKIYGTYLDDYSNNYGISTFDGLTGSMTDMTTYDRIGKSTNFVVSGLRLPNGNYLLVGQNNSQWVISCHSSAGNTIWRKQITHKLALSPFMVRLQTQVTSEGIYIIGPQSSTFYTWTNEPNFAVYYLDFNGTIKWTMSNTLPGTNLSISPEAKTTLDGDLVMNAYDRVAQQYVMARISKQNGAVQWKRLVTDGRLIQTLPTGNLCGVNYNGVEVRSPADGHVVWTWTNQDSGISSSVIDPDGNPIIQLANGDIYRLRRGDGSVCWHYTNGGTDSYDDQVIGADHQRVYLVGYDGESQVLRSISQSSAKPLYSMKLPLWCYTSRGFLSDDQGSLYMTGSQSNYMNVQLYTMRIDAKTGKTLWMQSRPYLGVGYEDVGSIVLSDTLDPVIFSSVSDPGGSGTFTNLTITKIARGN